MKEQNKITVIAAAICHGAGLGARAQGSKQISAINSSYKLVFDEKYSVATVDVSKGCVRRTAGPAAAGRRWGTCANAHDRSELAFGFDIAIELPTLTKDRRSLHILAFTRE